MKTASEESGRIMVLGEDDPGVAGANEGSALKRRFPFPHRALLAICSDLDETPDRDVYWNIVRYLNGTEDTSMGKGLGLEVGNTIYFDMPADQFAYWNTDDAGREMVRALIRTGHIDCLHSFGDLATSRRHAGRALEELARHSCELKVWVDHGTAISNFGGDIMRGLGDVPGADVFHADLTWDFGMRYVWRGRITSMAGQDGRLHYGGIFNTRHPGQSGKTLAKEVAKTVLAKLGSSQYKMHGRNDLLRSVQLRSGHRVTEFLRCNPYWGGVGASATADGIAAVLTAGFLDRLVARGAPAILYTHLGKIAGRRVPFTENTRAAFRGLAERFGLGEILVTTTRRLLDYEAEWSKVAARCRTQDGWEVLEIAVADSEALAGHTWYVRDATRTRVKVNGVDVKFSRNDKDETGRESISFPWKKLELPVLSG